MEIADPNNGLSNYSTQCARNMRVLADRCMISSERCVGSYKRRLMYTAWPVGIQTQLFTIDSTAPQQVFLCGYKLTRTVSPTAPPASIVSVTGICTTVYVLPLDLEANTNIKFCIISSSPGLRPAGLLAADTIIVDNHVVCSRHLFKASIQVKILGPCRPPSPVPALCEPTPHPTICSISQSRSGN